MPFLYIANYAFLFTQMLATIIWRCPEELVGGRQLTPPSRANSRAVVANSTLQHHHPVHMFLCLTLELRV